MAPVAHSDIESHTSDMASQDSPLRRQFSEPFHGHYASTQASQSPSPSPMTYYKSKCAWCGKFFESSNHNSISQHEALKEHIATVHPHIAKFSSYDGAADEDAENGHRHDYDEHLEDAEGAVAPEIDEHYAAEGEEEEDDMIEAEDGAVEGVEATEAYDDIEKDEDDLEAEAEGEGEANEESDLGLLNQLDEFLREQDSVSLEKRLHNLWNIHDIRKFSEDYDDKTAGLEETWNVVFRSPKRGKKRDAREFPNRPDPYKKTKVAKGEFLEISALEDFLVQLRDPEIRATDELYAITENVAYALKAWQDEYLAIDKLHKYATRHNVKTTTDPRKIARPQVFEDKKEAVLYGYKHETKEDKVGNQNPFVQGGFKPTPAQCRKINAKADQDPNPDGWPTIYKFGVAHVPKFQNPPREEFVGKATRKRKAAELEAASKANETDEALVESPAPAEAEQEHLVKRRTRNRRVATEFAQSQTTSATPAPVSTRASTRGRGRGRGRGVSSIPSRGASETPQPAPLAPARASGRGYGHDAPMPTSTTTPALLQARPAPMPPALSHLAPIEPAPSGGPAAAPPATTLPGGVHPDELLDPVELARRQKIANSKNPKRTEAMLNHWARFNREGRVRNPKRTKAQIEADRVAEAAKKAAEVPKTGVKKQKSESPVFRSSGADTGIAPAPAPPMPPVSAPLPPPGPPGIHPQLAPMPTARGSMVSPYAPIDPRAVAPFPPGPPGPLQQPPPQMPYRTPYPDYYIPYGAAAAGLPPPGHTRPA